MSLGDWLLIGATGLLAKKLSDIDEDDLKLNNSESEYEDNISMDEYTKIHDLRCQTPCKFEKELSYDEFSDIAHKYLDKIKRIKDVKIIGAKIECVMFSQTSCSEWCFEIDFNDWGHITGEYWLYNENTDSIIPKKISENISRAIKERVYNKVKFQSYSEYINENVQFDEKEEYIYKVKKNILEKISSRKKHLTIKCNVKELCGEHILFVLSYLKDIGAGKIIVKPIKDINSKSNNYLYEVENIVIMQDGNIVNEAELTQNSEFLILYHSKLEVLNQHSSSYFRKKQLNDVLTELKTLGFENIECNKIEDVILGLFVKENSVGSVTVGTDEMPIRKMNYKYDDKIIINYHTR